MSAVVDRPVRADFEVHLDVYDGPLDVLLGLIAKRELDITEVALGEVTDEFVAYVRSRAFDLDAATSFLVVAATLLDLKTARLLPGSPEADEEDLALLEARDLLFARLLQYRAFKQLAGWLAESMATEAAWIGREVALPAELAAVRPRVVLGTDARGLAGIAARALTPRPPDVVALEHLHAARVSVAEHVEVVTERLLAAGSASFRSLCQDCRELIEVVARFLAVLELFRDGRVRFDQVVALGELSVSWTGGVVDGGPPSRAVVAVVGSAPTSG